MKKIIMAAAICLAFIACNNSEWNDENEEVDEQGLPVTKAAPVKDTVKVQTLAVK